MCLPRNRWNMQRSGITHSSDYVSLVAVLPFFAAGGDYRYPLEL